MTALATQLRRLKACPEARTWAEPYTTLAEAWAVCPRGDWMHWLLDALDTHAEPRQTAAYRAADRAVRVYAVSALRSAGLGAHADTLAALTPITDAATAAAAGRAAHAAWNATDAARSASAAAGSAELLHQADDLRELIPNPEVKS